MKSKKNIVWIASYPKSGNTWFRSFLSCLLFSKDQSIDINNLTHIPVASSRSVIDKYSGVASSELLPGEIEELRAIVYRRIAEESEELKFFKVHDSWHLTPSGKKIFDPEITKGVIYLIRNPLDIAVSFSNHLGVGINETIRKMGKQESELCFRDEKLHHQFRQRLSDWSGHVNSWTKYSGLPVKVLQYESMLEDVESSFRSALDFLEIKVQEEQFQKALKACSFENLASQEVKNGFTEKPITMKRFFNSGSSGDGSKILTNEQKQRILDQHSPTMADYGYIK